MTMKRNRFVIWPVFVLAAAAAFAADREETSSGKKIIEYGWDVPTLEYIADNISAMEQRPFDGIIFKLAGGNNVLEPQADGEGRFEADLKAAPRVSWNAFTDNFVLMLAASDQDWFSDAHWENITRRAARMACIGRHARCKGVCFDPEPYGTNPWSYLTAAHVREKTFAEYRAMARRRGAQFIMAIERELPAPKVLTFFLLSTFRDLMLPMDEALRLERLSRDRYALLAPFLEGMLTASSAGTEFIDGNESAYYYTEAQEYFAAYHTVTQRASYLVAPEFWPLYRDKVRMGQALYMDYYYDLRNNKTLGAYMTPAQQARWFEHNAHHALHTADTYVWCYSESMDWWQDRDIPSGAEAALRNARRAIDTGQPLAFELAPIIAAAAEKRERDQEGGVLVRRTAWIPRLPDSIAPPAVDGVLDDAAWREGVALESFVPPVNHPAPVAAQTEARMLHDDAGIYIGARCHYPAGSKAAQKEQLQAVFKPLGRRDTLCRVILTPDGKVTVENASAEACRGAAKDGADAWTAEVFLAWEAFEISGLSPRLRLRGNIGRRSGEDGAITAWRSVRDNLGEPRSMGSWYFR
jgi:hypothetical protein